MDRGYPACRIWGKRLLNYFLFKSITIAMEHTEKYARVYIGKNQLADDETELMRAAGLEEGDHYFFSYLTLDQYNWQMMHPDAKWKCPLTTYEMWFDDSYFEEVHCTP